MVFSGGFFTRHCINLLSNIPLQCTEPLTAPIKKDLVSADEAAVKEIEYDGASMNAPKAMLDFLHAKVEEVF